MVSVCWSFCCWGLEGIKGRTPLDSCRSVPGFTRPRPTPALPTGARSTMVRRMDSHDFNSEVETRLKEALFGTAMTGIEATGAVYPLGAFLLVGAMLDMLAGLMHAPASDSDRQQ